MNEIFNTKLVNVEYKLGINGWIHPIVEFEPHTFDDGITVSRFELSHTLDIRKFKLGVGDELIMYRSGSSIVKIVDNITKSDTIPTPIRCPFCNIYTTKKNEDMFCNYRFCREVKLKKFAHFIRAMDIKIGVETVKKLIYQHDKHNPCTNPIQLMDVKEKKLRAMFGDFEGKKIYQSVQDAKHTSLDRFIWALNIVPHEYAKRLSDDCNGDVDTFITRCLNNYDWTHIKDFSNQRSDEVNSQVKLYQSEIKALRMKLFFDNEVSDDNPIYNKIFVVTGEISLFKNRNELLRFIDNLGGHVVGAVTKDIDYVINNDKRIMSNPKNKDAKIFNIPVITEQEFMELCGDFADV